MSAGEPAIAQSREAEGRIAGRVTDAASGAALAEVTVVLTGASEGGQPAQILRDSGADGAFLFEAVRAGTYRLDFTHTGYRASSIAELVVPPGQEVNSLFVNVSTPCLAIDTDAGETATGHDMANHQTADLTRMIATSCDGSAGLAAAAGLVADNGDAFAAFDTGGATCGAVDYDNIRASGGGFTGLVDEDPNFNAKSFAGGGYDPRPLGPGADCGVTPKLPGLDRAATYRGAFPAGQPLWTDGWTALDQAGAL